MTPYEVVYGVKAHREVIHPDPDPDIDKESEECEEERPKKTTKSTGQSGKVQQANGTANTEKK